MDAAGSGKLRQTTDRFFHFSRTDHHQIRQLVHDDQNLRQLRRRLRIPDLPHTLYLLIITLKITDIIVRKLLVTVRHLRHTPVQRGSGLLRIRHHRNQQVRYPVIDTQLHHLRIYHDHLDVFRLRLIQNTHNDCIDTDRLTGTGSSRDQHMGHFGDIRHHDLAADVFTHRKSEVGGELPELFGLHQFPERHCRILLVRYFYADGRFARYRRLDADIRSGQIQLDIVGQTDDLADLDSLLRLHLVAGDRRPLTDVRDGDLDAECSQRLLQMHGRLLQLSGRISAVVVLCLGQKLVGGELIRSGRLCLLSRILFLCPDGIGGSTLCGGILRRGIDRPAALMDGRFLLLPDKSLESGLLRLLRNLLFFRDRPVNPDLAQIVRLVFYVMSGISVLNRRRLFCHKRLLFRQLQRDLMNIVPYLLHRLFLLIFIQRRIEHDAGHLLIHAQNLLVLELFFPQPALFLCPCAFLFCPGTLLLQRLAPLLRPLSAVLGVLHGTLVHPAALLRHPADKRFLRDDHHTDHAQHKNRQHGPHHAQKLTGSIQQRPCYHTAPVMILAAAQIDLLQLPALCLLGGKKLAHHTDQQEEHYPGDQLPDRDVIPCIDHAESDRQEYDRRRNICQQTEYAEHHAADHIAGLADHAEIAKKKDDRKRKKHDQ